jgi:eukaryotic-like serine/threonine-protein kinase
MPRGRGPLDETEVLVPEPVPPPGAPLEEPPPNRALWPWLLVLLVLVLAGIAAAIIATHDKKHHPAAATTAPPPTTTQAATPRPLPKPKPTPAVKEVAVPKLLGLSAPTALRAARAAGLTATTKGVFSDKPRNTVVRQSPAAATKVAKGATLTLLVSKGPKAAPVPDVVGQDSAAAIASMKAAGFAPKTVNVPSAEPAGRVVAQHPAAGQKAPAGTDVRLNISTGKGAAPATTAAATTAPVTTAPATTAPATTAPATTTAPAPRPATVAVPDVRGMKLLAARHAIRNVGLVTEWKRVPNSQPRGTVVSQSPKPGTKARRGAHVLVNTSLGPPAPKPAAGGTTTATTAPAVPDVTGEDVHTATQDLQAAGFTVNVVQQDVTDQSEDGIVIQQSPSAGQTAPAHSQVTIYEGRFSGG